jgi:hypothetical protein
MKEFTYKLDLGRFDACKDPSFEWSEPGLLKYCRENGFNSSERKFLSLWGSSELEDASYAAGELVLKRGVVPVSALLVMDGVLVWESSGGTKHIFGPGSVVGMAEGLAGLALSGDITAETLSHVKLLNLLDFEMELEKTPAQLSSLFRISIERILGERFYGSDV